MSFPNLTQGSVPTSLASRYFFFFLLLTGHKEEEGPPWAMTAESAEVPWSWVALGGGVVNCRSLPSGQSQAALRRVVTVVGGSSPRWSWD